MGLTTLVAGLFAGIVSAQAPADLSLAKPNPRFREYKTFRCTFTESEGRAFEQTPPKNLQGDKYPEIILDNVDYTKRTARLIGNVGSDDVSVIDGDLAVTFVSVTVTGNVIINTIFKTNRSEFDQSLRIVTSRHIAQPIGGDIVGQYYGTCRALL
jgi:hypothetical protein